MPGFMRRKTTISSKALVERARILGVPVPEYSMPSAQADVEISQNVRDAAAEIILKLEEAKRSGLLSRSNGAVVAAKQGSTTVTQTRPSGSGRSKSDPKIFRLSI